MQVSSESKFEVGDLVIFRNRCQTFPYMTVEKVDEASLFGDVRYQLDGVQGWWVSANLMKYGG